MQQGASRQARAGAIPKVAPGVPDLVHPLLLAGILTLAAQPRVVSAQEDRFVLQVCPCMP